MIAWTSTVPENVPGSGPELQLYDSSSQEIRPLPPGAGTGMYVCGITPYDATHIGHASTYVAFDLLNRYWRDGGADVQYVQNVTDVDDPLLERAEATGIDWRDLAVQQTNLFRADMEALNVLAPQHYVGAVETVDWLVPVVEDLLGEGIAYTVSSDDGEPDGDVYFSVENGQSAYSGQNAWYLGQISGLPEATMLELSAERGGDPNRPGKRNALDPLLWRVARSGEPHWDGGTLGRGRPGWHIECSVIAKRLLPQPFAVQGGGSDLVFPHHEMSAAHAWASTRVPLAHHYCHAGMVALDGEKMSKSKGNLVFVSRLLNSGVDPAAIRLAILAHHYRSDWSWTEEGLGTAQRRVEVWRSAVRRGTEEATAASLTQAVRQAMADDLDAPAALLAVDEWCEQGATGGGHGTEVATLMSSLLGVRL
ncbi:cysteine--1-D-myo-inosityl 2-amino-2-deoxy-alpha-D-glucopyranoside ligase [Arthrobacter roseus]|uniref:cysteine--1-D-myo-inosityl 2-amino-2-deoxy-alpha-D-glucopyranoside ligase n=1 Tax=Arthrobacter roseus TaxID=136274 RepID=UPI001962C398|nr:L-cysteine:1D-myo-inositol 2-amino-2-deoxy-alpha-D-glucopyranoside ligase [Arthrobacter roseus]